MARNNNEWEQVGGVYRRKPKKNNDLNFIQIVALGVVGIIFLALIA